MTGLVTSGILATIPQLSSHMVYILVTIDDEMIKSLLRRTEYTNKQTYRLVINGLIDREIATRHQYTQRQ